MVRLYVPVGVVVAVVTLMLEVPAVGLGLKVAVAPAGTPEALSVTFPANPPEGVTVTVYDVLAPCTTVWLAGEEESE
jgi:hypothetical protein